MLQGHMETKNKEMVYVYGELNSDLCWVSTEERLLPIVGWSALEVLDILAKAKRDGQI